MTGRPDVPNRDLLETIAEEFDDHPDVAMGTMFRMPGLRVGGKIFAFLGHGGELIAKLAADRAGEFVDSGAAERVVMGKRAMREWFEFAPQQDRAATLTLWRRVAREAREYVGGPRTT